jgi:hypothetical protein
MAFTRAFVVKWGTIGAYPHPDEEDGEYDEVRIEMDTHTGKIELEVSARDAKLLAGQITEALQSMEEGEDDGEEEEDDDND